MIRSLKHFLIIILSASFTSCVAQQVPEIDNSEVARIIKTLAADDMQGRATFTPGAEKAASFIEAEFQRIGLVPLSGQASFRQEFKYHNQPDSSIFNVAGIIPGRSKANEFVIFSAHYDHIGIRRPIDGDSIANGADDDASGVTAVITLAEYYKKLNNNERTLIFVAFSGEERGGFGSAYFSQQMNPDNVSAMFNIEMIGKESKFGKNSAFITGYERSDFGTILQHNLEGTGFTFHPDPYPAQNLFYRSDNARLAAQGVPAHTISTDQIDTDSLYHTVNDEFESLDVNNITSTIKAIALSSRSIVAGTDTPRRIPKLTR